MSEWYGSTISSTYSEFQQDRAGVPRYKMLKVQRPKDLTLKNSDDFTRFAISYGLSVPFGEGDFRLPSQFAEAEKPRDYADTKDVYD